MIIAIWDFLFTRRLWKIIDRQELHGQAWNGQRAKIADIYVLQDQFGNVKRKRI